ncbi:MAG TPA: DEAD/DEAH box helicase [Candidatus Manganitrophaceae bacterium]|nr:DEAD/DEAH box helicase [Candidatus Manganitrophaceae bacterium]
MTAEENDILRFLKAVPPNAVYSLAPKAFFLRGFQYHREERVKSYGWSQNGAILTASVLGTRLYSVQCSVEEGALSFTCDCPVWTPSSNCKHVVCALLTTLHLLSPNLFRIPVENLERFKVLESSLWGRRPLPEKSADLSGAPARAERKKPPYEVVIEEGENALAPSILREGRKVESSWEVPDELSFFLSSSFYSSSFFSQNLVRYFNHYGMKYPLILKTAEGSAEMKWDPSLVYEGKTEIDASGDRIRVRPVCLLKEVVHEKARRFRSVVFDLDTNRIGIVKETRAWDLYDEWERVFSSSDPDDGWGGHTPGRLSLQLSLRHFQSAQILSSRDEMKELLSRLILKVDGAPAPIHQAEHAYRLTIDPLPEAAPPEAGAPQSLLRAECRLGGAAAAPTASAFGFFEYLQIPKNLSSALKAQKRKGALYGAFFALLSTCKKSETEKTLRESLSGEDFNKFSVRSEAKNILKHFFSAYSTPDARIQFSDGRWFVVPNNKPREALLYQIPFELFGPEIFRETRSHDEMRVDAERLHEKLPSLYSKLKEAGIELFYQNKPVVTSRWDFSFDARRASGVDWFEIRPEIRCDGAVIEGAEWIDLLHRGGVVERGDLIRILDSNAQEILKTLSMIYKSADPTGRDKRDGTPNIKEIVRTPRLRILDWIALRKQGVRVKLSEEDERLIERLTRFEKIERSPAPKRLQAALRPYQKEGYDWLAFLYRHQFGACLADDMGLGKTLQAISLLAGIKEEKIPPSGAAAGRPHLVVLPPSLLFNWENEIARFYPELKIHFYAGKERRADFKGADVVLTTYDLVRRDIETLKEIPFHVIIFDEAQAIKNIYTDRTGAVRRLKGSFKLVMTGTPIENHLGEYYSLIDLALPGLLGDYDDFKSQIDLERSPLLELIIRRTRPFVLRRTKEKILKELPPKVETDVYLELTPKQKGLYRMTVAQIRSRIDDAYQNKTGPQAQIIALTALLKLRQLCVSPRLIAPDIDDPSPKIEFLIGRLTELLTAGHSALVFSQFTSFLDILEEELKKTVIPYARLDGSTAVGKRKRLVEGFQEGAAPSVFLLSLKAGGQGLNLTKASYVFHLDPWWNPAVENQASDRAHRIGQKNKVSITRILMRHTIEEKMMELKKKKLALYHAVLGDEAKSGRSFSISKSDFDFLLED